MKKLLITAFVVILGLGGVSSANAQGVCLDYWIKGPSACKNQQKQTHKIKIDIDNVQGDLSKVKKDEARIQYENALNKRIDKFLANYGKPPREFVAFHLDPSLENAIRWVKKFREEVNRTSKIAVAWKQAEAIFEEYRDTGTVTLPAESGVSESDLKYLMQAFEEDATDLPKVKGFGVNLDGDWDERSLSRDFATLRYKDENGNRVTSLETMQKYAKNALPESYKDSVSYQQAVNVIKQSKKENKVAKQMEPIEVNYYFSAKCAFCVKFSKALDRAVKRVGKNKVKLTCVDMTPGDKKQSNISGVDCKWRPLLDGETKKLGVKRTPTIIVKRPGSKTLELLENYHETEELVKYFREGPASGKIRK